MSKIQLIAEIGINHNGDVSKALEMIKCAHEANWDAVKLQKRNIDAVYSSDELSKPRESPFGTTTREQKEGLELGGDEYREIDGFCKTIGIPWFASAWDIESLEFLTAYNPPAHKICSAMIIDLEFLRAVADQGLLTYISTGASTAPQIFAAAQIFEDSGCPYVIMHCVMQYPVSDLNANMFSIKHIDNIFRSCPEHWRNYRGIGYSGHEEPLNMLPCITAVALGAGWIERHITLDRTDYGSDQAASMEPAEMAELRELADKVVQICGDGRIDMMTHEQEAAAKLRAHIK